ncbi:MAG: hypothetical protein ACI86M_001007, partial [Saprospiraceae bacterium]
FFGFYKKRKTLGQTVLAGYFSVSTRNEKR